MREGGRERDKGMWCPFQGSKCKVLNASVKLHERVGREVRSRSESSRSLRRKQLYEALEGTDTIPITMTMFPR